MMLLRCALLANQACLVRVLSYVWMCCFVQPSYAPLLRGVHEVWHVYVPDAA
jgi:hypothetical protein